MTRAVLAVVVANVVENEEFSFRCEEGSVCDAGACKIRLSLACYLTWVLRIDFTVAWVVNVKDHDQGLLVAEGIEVGSGYVWNKLHV